MIYRTFYYTDFSELLTVLNGISVYYNKQNLVMKHLIMVKDTGFAIHYKLYEKI